MNSPVHYRCSQCGAEYPVRPTLMVCSDCAAKQGPEEPLRGLLEVAWDFSRAGWDSRGVGDEGASVEGLLPVPPSFFPPIPVGNTPLWEPQRLRESTGFPHLYLKDDTANPTGSLKDRASYLVAAFARQHGYEEIVLASTGNAGSSMAGVGAAAGLRVVLFLPWDAPAAKRVQAQQYGARVIRVQGSYDQAGREAMAYLRENPRAMCRSTAYHPMTLEGKKTAALEIHRQLGFPGSASDPPEHIFVPTGDGCILGGIIKGFQDLKEAGRIRRMPRFWSVQSAGSCAVNRALKNNGVFGKPVTADTAADSISVDVPAAGYYVTERLRKYGGRGITVSDGAILAAQGRLARESGLFAEPAAAAALAGFTAAAEERDGPRPEDRVVLLITGSGLKDIDTAMRAFKGGS